ncbi:MAG TPA: hypothetical protein VGQ60_03630 [Nitrospiraceae bacterium]|nr:hypothetical protein [Nitrospiraceae bacterium]
MAGILLMIVPVFIYVGAHGTKMLFYSFYLVTGLVNALLLLFLAGTMKGTTLIPYLAIVGALFLFATSGVSLYRPKLGAWLALICTSPILLWVVLALAEESQWSKLPLLPPFLFLLAAIAMSIFTLTRDRPVSDRQDSANRIFRALLALAPAVLVTAYILLLFATSLKIS